MPFSNNSFGLDVNPGLVDQEEMSIPRIAKDDIAVVDDTVPTQVSVEPETEYCFREKRYFPWIFFTLVTISAALGVAILLGGFRGSHRANRDDSAFYDREGYYEELQATFLPLTGSPQDQAIEWLAFHDTPLEGNARNHLMQRFALVVFYFTHGGPTTWNSINDSQSGWISHGGGIHECQWRGVDCNSADEVTGLRLPAGEGIALTGSSLASEIGLLTSLQYFDGANQRLQGTIPSEWGSLTNMIMLDLSNNEIRSTIPSFIGAFSNLSSLMLGGNLLTGHFPQTLLESNIDRLELQDNVRFGGRVEQLFQSLRKLSYLDVSRTSVTGSLPSLPLESLKVLLAWGSLLTGTIPSEIGTWTSLEKLNLGELESFRGSMPSELGALTGLESLELSYMADMRGTLPSEIGQLVNLAKLDLRVCSYSGTLPSEYSQLENLVILDVAYNSNIVGTIPSEYGKMTSLKNVFMHGTSLSGSVSPVFCSVDFLQFTTECKEKGDDKMVCTCCTDCFNTP